MIKARASGSKVNLYFMKKGRQARHCILRNSWFLYLTSWVLLFENNRIYNNWLSAASQAGENRLSPASEAGDNRLSAATSFRYHFFSSPEPKAPWELIGW